MTKKTYVDKNSDLEALCKDIISWFGEQGYQVQSNKNTNTWFIQAQKTEAWRKAVAASRAFNVLIQGQPNDFFVEVGTGEWANNLTAGGVAAVITGGASLLVSGIAAGWSKKIESDIWNCIDQKVMFGTKVKSAREMAVIKAEQSVEQKLEQLKEVFDQGFIDEAAYLVKKQQIENQSLDQKKNAELNEKLEKLKNAVEAGILTQEEYETKKAELMAQTSNVELDNKLAQLRSALGAGILSQAEFDIKAAAIQKEIAFTEKLKQLENARNAGIITPAEFETKKAELLS